MVWYIFAQYDIYTNDAHQGFHCPQHQDRPGRENVSKVFFRLFAPGAWCMALSTWYMALSTWCWNICTWHLLPGAWFKVVFTWYIFDFSFAHLVFDLYDAVIVAGVHQWRRVRALSVRPTLQMSHQYLIIDFTANTTFRYAINTWYWGNTVLLTSHIPLHYGAAAMGRWD